MSKSILKDCTIVNTMGILDPKIINNPAVYSILTNKYYMAQKRKDFNEYRSNDRSKRDENFPI